MKEKQRIKYERQQKGKDCERYEKLIMSLADSPLSEFNQAALSAHIRVCPSCRRCYELYTNLLKTLHEMQKEAPPMLTQRVMREIRSTGQPASAAKPRWWQRRHPPHRLAVTVCCCALVLLAGALIAPPILQKSGSKMSMMDAVSQTAAGSLIEMLPEPAQDGIIEILPEASAGSEASPNQENGEAGTSPQAPAETTETFTLSEESFSALLIMLELFPTDDAAPDSEQPDYSFEITREEDPVTAMTIDISNGVVAATDTAGNRFLAGCAPDELLGFLSAH